MAAVVLVVGTSNSGKTTLVEKLIKELVGRGRRIAAVKHNRRGFDVDTPGKDTWRMAEAGAAAVAMASPNQLAVIKRTEEEPVLKQVLDLLGDDYDLVLVEGYKKGRAPKIEVFRAGVSEEFVCGADDECLAIVTDLEREFSVPRFGLDQVDLVADLIEERFLGA